MRHLRIFLLLTILATYGWSFEQQRPPAPAPKASAPKAAAPAVPKEEGFRFAIIGDTGTGGSSQYQIAEALDAMRAKFPFEIVLMMGDNMYGSEAPKDFVRKFERPYQTMINAGVKFYATLGNHDDAAVQKSYEGFNFGGEHYYSFKPKNGIRFFSLDSNYMDKKQLDWLEKELQNSGSDWKICFFHHPIYSSGEKHGSNVELRTMVEPLFIKYGVDVVLTGHEHFYERIKPQKGIHYFIVGSSAKLRKGNVGKTALTAKAFDQDYAFMVAEIAGDKMSFQVVTRKGTVVDSGTIVRAEKRATAAASPR